MRNLAYEKAQATRLKEMRDLMQQDLEAIGRPFGEFIPGGNAALPGQIGKQIEIVKQLEIKGKTVIVPEALKKDLGVTDEPTPDDKTGKKKRNAKRVKRLAKKPDPTNGKPRINNPGKFPSLCFFIRRIVRFCLSVEHAALL
ncbi:MAG: hypothetical protein P8M80_18880 [Pirellulaceae bacterium]|nr:hypothetical protein [Pirellulaceae bacterium]